MRLHKIIAKIRLPESSFVFPSGLIFTMIWGKNPGELIYEKIKVLGRRIC